MLVFSLIRTEDIYQKFSYNQNNHLFVQLANNTAPKPEHSHHLKSIISLCVHTTWEAK